MDADTSPNPSSYTDEQREEALRLYVEHGPGEASRRCGVPSATIRSWAHRAGLTRSLPASDQTKAATEAARLTWAQRRLELARETGVAAAELLDRLRNTEKASEVGRWPAASACWSRM